MSETLAHVQEPVGDRTDDVGPADSPAAVELRKFRVYSPGLARIAALLPWVIVAITAAAIWIYGADQMFISGLIAAAIAGFLISMLGQVAPEALKSVWTRNLLSSREPTRPVDPQFAAFVRGFRESLESRWSVGVGVFFAIAAVPQFFISPRVANPLEVLQASGLRGLVAFVTEWQVIGLLAIAAVGYVLGLLAWRMGCIGYQIYRLGARFECRVQTQHPDGAGGFGALGELCFLNALVVIVPSIFLGVWRTLIANVPAYRATYGYLTDWFGVLLLATFVIALVAFVAPLYGVHKAMARERLRRQPELDRLGNAMDALINKIRETAESGAVTQLPALKDQYAVLQELYKKERNVPTWPVDTSLVSKYFVTQIVPLLSVTKVADAIASRLLGGA